MSLNTEYSQQGSNRQRVIRRYLCHNDERKENDLHSNYILILIACKLFFFLVLKKRSGAKERSQHLFYFVHQEILTFKVAMGLWDSEKMHPVCPNPKQSGNKEGTEVQAVQNIAVLQCSFLSKYFSQSKDCNNNKTVAVANLPTKIIIYLWSTNIWYKIIL